MQRHGRRGAARGPGLGPAAPELRPTAQASAAIEAGEDAQLVAAQAIGAEGLREQYPFARHLMGARVAGFVDGSTEMLLKRISAVMRR